MLGEGTLAEGYPDDVLESVVVFERNAAGEQLINVYEGLSAVGTPLISFTSATLGAAGPWAGTMGGAFVNVAESFINTDISVEILDMVAHHYA